MTKSQPNNPEHEPKTFAEWASWLFEQEQKSFNAYRAKPELLVADGIRERASTRDYEGREILELLQNANDAAAESGQASAVIIELHPDGLIVANTGNPFSTEGVTSLQTANLSPKRRNRKSFIGNKGLGFRAVLNWSQSPIIISGALHLVFGRCHAQRKVSELTKTSAVLADLVLKESDDGEFAYPVLTFPAFSQDGNIFSFMPDQPTQAILERCQALHSDGFTTVIGMPFDQPEALDHATGQLASLTPELLLFVKNLREITIRKLTKPQTAWKRDPVENGIKVSINDRADQEWEVHSETKPIPREHLVKDQSRVTEYEIVVAIPKVRPAPNFPLFSYFPTNVTFPLPLVCHATLELEQNRKHPQGGAANRFVLQRLAAFIAETVELYVKNHPDQPWAGYDLLTCTRDFGADLNQIEFKKHLLEAAATKLICPTVSGVMTAPKAGKLMVKGASDAWLPAKGFEDVIRCREQRDWDFLQSMSPVFLSPTQIKERLLALTSLTLDQRATLVAGLVEHAPSTVHSPALLLDFNGNQIPEDSRIFLSPSGGPTAKLPPWMEVRFLNEDLRKALNEKLGCKDARELQNRLATFRVAEFSLDNLITGLVATTNRRKQVDPEKSNQFDTELLETLFQLYPASTPPEKRNKFPSSASVRVPTQAGMFADSKSAYLSAGYPLYGAVMQDLLSSYPHKLLARPEQFAFSKDSALTADFFQWLGVAIWPRQIRKENLEYAFVNSTLQSLIYPARFDDKVFNSPQSVTSASFDGNTLDCLSEILASAESTAILAWLALDERASHWHRPSGEHGTLRAKPSGAQNYRAYSGPVPSYIRWKIANTAWLPLTSGTVGKPAEAIAADRAIELVFPRPQIPSPELLKKYDLTASDVQTAWARAGVAPGFAYLERDQLYKILLALPERDPKGEQAKALYNWLLDADSSAIGEAGAAFHEFKARGKMWGRHGKEARYFPIQELRHADSEDLPELLLSRLKLVDLPKRKGAEKVEKVFGVPPVDKDQIGKAVHRVQLAVGAPEVSLEFESVKPYLFALRQSQTAQAQSLARLQKLGLQVCSEITIALTYEGHSFTHDLAVWDWIIVDDILYVRSDPLENIALTSDLLSDAIGSALASLFRLGSGADFARVLSCDEKNREALLNKIRGEDSSELIRQSKQLFDSGRAATEYLFRFPEMPEPRPSLPTPPSTPQVEIINQLPLASDAQDQTPVQPLQIAEQERTPAPPRAVALRIQKPQSPGPNILILIKSKAQTDWQFCQKKTMEFELSDDPPRFPLLVADVQGYEAPGCDILSFITKEKRDQFLSAEKKSDQLVERFIEVKARSNEHARIALKGHELDAAIRYGERYYLYRFFEDDAEFVLAVLKHPTSAKEALSQVLDVNLEKANETREIRLTGGMSKAECEKWNGLSLPEMPSQNAPT